MAVYEYHDYDVVNQPETLYVSYPNVVKIYSVTDDETDLAPALLEAGKLVALGVPVVATFAVVNDYASSTATFESDPNTTFLVEYSDDLASWTQETATTDADGIATTVVPGVSRYYRVKFPYVHSSWTSTVATFDAIPHLWLTYETTAQAVPVWKIAKVCIPMSTYFYSGETALFLARIEESSTGVLLLPSDVEKITYTAYKIRKFGSTKTRQPIVGHENVSVPVAAILETLETNDQRWNERVDDRGYNFRYEPNTRENPIFPEAGSYEIVFAVTPFLGNPAPIVYSIKTT